jgi:hypothetical protein
VKSKDKNYINKITGKRTLKKGAFKQDSNFFLEFQEYLKSEKEKTGVNIISFIPDTATDGLQANLPIPLAAKSEELYESKKIRTFFYNVPGKDIVLKLSIKNRNQIYATVIAETSFDVQDSLLYCRETGKFFVCGKKFEYYLGLYDSFRENDFNFDLFMPAGKLVIFRSGESISHFSDKEEYPCRAVILNDEGILIELNPEMKFTSAVLKSGSYKDFMTVKDNHVNIAKALIKDKMEILFY